MDSFSKLLMLEKIEPKGTSWGVLFTGMYGNVYRCLCH